MYVVVVLNYVAGKSFPSLRLLEDYGVVMASTLTKRELSEEILFGGPEARAREHISKLAKQYRTGQFSQIATTQGLGVVRLPEFRSVQALTLEPAPLHSAPRVVPVPTPSRSTRRAPWTVRINRVLQTALMAACALVVLGYGLDVAVSNEVTRQQEQVQRLGEENSELSAKLLKMVAYDSLQQSGPARFGLRSPDHVVIVPEAEPAKAKPFKPTRHHLPLMSGY
jgi:hypothetical protein